MILLNTILSLQEYSYTLKERLRILIHNLNIEKIFIIIFILGICFYRHEIDIIDCTYFNWLIFIIWILIYAFVITLKQYTTLYTEEAKHLELARNFINDNIWLFENTPLTDDQTDKLESFFYKWKEFAENELHWTPKLIKAIIGTGHKVINTKGEIQKLSDGNAIATLMVAAESNCKCNKDNTIGFCSVGYCQKSSCEELTYGCGWLLAQACNGECLP